MPAGGVSFLFLRHPLPCLALVTLLILACRLEVALTGLVLLFVLLRAPVASLLRLVVRGIALAVVGAAHTAAKCHHPAPAVRLRAARLAPLRLAAAAHGDADGHRVRATSTPEIDE
eukprot:scaffold56_cov33-Tisochrysis_lutea.AAC.1